MIQRAERGLVLTQWENVSRNRSRGSGTLANNFCSMAALLNLRRASVVRIWPLRVELSSMSDSLRKRPANATGS